MSDTYILKCSCQNSYQDEKYGKQMRVFNQKKDGSLRCTACGHEIRK